MDEHRKSPLTAEEQDSPQPERMVTPQEEAGQDLQQLEDPPQAEGPREDEESPEAGGRLEQLGRGVDVPGGAATPAPGTASRGNDGGKSAFAD